MELADQFILMIGESGVGKTHYGGQLLKRLMREDGSIGMNGAATNLEPFEAVMARLDAGLLADHTSTAVYHESRWPIADHAGRQGNLIWPDYGGEQIMEIINERRLPRAWLDRIAQSSAWLLLIRPQKTRADDDVFSRPLTCLKASRGEPGLAGVSDQARLVELLQMLVYGRSTSPTGQARLPKLVVLLTCWDELKDPGRPIDVLHERLPMFCDFLESNWEKWLAVGVSALGRALDKREPDQEYISRGSEEFGYVVLEDGRQSEDLTLPIKELLANEA